MHCQVMDTLYIRSNGDVPCAHDAGEPIILGRVDASFSATAMLDGPGYRHVRTALAAGRLPWPDVCGSCACFRPEEPFRDALSTRHVHKLQFEASLACNLACPACTNGAQVKVRPQPFILPLDLAGRALRTLRDEGFRIDEIEYAGQGEPLANPRFPELVDLARDLFPDTRQRLITNGNYDYWKRTGGRALDEIFVSCDGLFQASYEKYRIGGKVETALAFMRDAPRTRDGRRQLMIWKYILFEFNDSDEELAAAQEMALRLGVDTMLFIFTDSAFRSLRWTPRNAALFPRLFPNVVAHGTPTVDRRSGAAGCRVRAPLPSRRLRLAGATWCVDDVRVVDHRLNMRGWAFARMPITRMAVSIDAASLGEATIGLPRTDVLARVDRCRRPDAGFAFSQQAPPLEGEHEIGLTLFSRGWCLGTAHERYHFSRPDTVPLPITPA